MTGPISKLLVLTSGGDSPGMNAAVRAVVRTGHFHGIQVFGALKGYRGLVDQEVIALPPASVANCIQRGGTILKTDRCLEFHEPKVRKKCIEYLQKIGIDAMVVIGGDGTFRGGALLHSEGGPPLMGIPATIDNDIAGTQYTIGFDTARNTALRAIDAIRDTASSHERNFIVEVMGRNTGFLALDVGISGGAEIILVPEQKMDPKEIAAKVVSPRREKLSSIIVMAEGATEGNVFDLAEKLKDLTKVEYRVCVLGHTQRGGTPTVRDRKIASCMGALAVRELHNGGSTGMIAFQDGDLVAAPLPDPKDNRRTLQDERLFELTEILAT